MFKKWNFFFYSAKLGEIQLISQNVKRIDFRAITELSFEYNLSTIGLKSRKFSSTKVEFLSISFGVLENIKCVLNGNKNR